MVYTRKKLICARATYGAVWLFPYQLWPYYSVCEAVRVNNVDILI